MSTDDIEVQIMPDPGDIVFDDDDTPFLTLADRPPNGECWVLYFMDETDGVEDYVTGLPPEALDEALDAARRWLRMRG